MDIYWNGINLRKIANWKSLKKIYNSCENKDAAGFLTGENNSEMCSNCPLSILQGIFIQDGQKCFYSVCFLLDHDGVQDHPPVETIKQLTIGYHR